MEDKTSILRIQRKENRGLFVDFRALLSQETVGNFLAVIIMLFHLVPCRSPISLCSFLFSFSSAIMKRYLGALNQKEHIRSTTSTCGNFVISGSEDGTAYVWNSETGKGLLFHYFR